MSSPAPTIRAVPVDDLEPVWAGIVADDLNPQRDGEWFGAYEGSVLVGAAHLVEVEGSHLFDDLWVRPADRGRGIGRALVARMQRLRSTLWLIADPDGVSYYEALGFQVDPGLPFADREAVRTIGPMAGPPGPCPRRNAVVPPTLKKNYLRNP
jgi:GNAT superfamily N-acetyltransferase